VVKKKIWLGNFFYRNFGALGPFDFFICGFA